jgi:hypothetical protein
MLDGHHALYKVGARLEERGMFPLLQPGLTRASLHDSRLGQSLEELCAAHLNRLFGAIALNALEVIRIRRRSACMGLTRRQPAWAKDLSRLGRPMGIAKMGARISRRCF